MCLRSLNVAPRATLFFTSIIALVCLLGAFAVLQMGKLRGAEKDVELNWMASIRQTAQIDKATIRLGLEIQRGLADPQSIQKNIESFAGYRKAITDAVTNYESLIASDKERSLYTAVKNSADAYSRQLDILEPLMRQGDIAAALSLVSTGIRPLTNKMEEQIKDLANINNEGAVQAGRHSTDLYNNGLWLVVGLIVGVVVLTVGLALLLTKSITSPLNDALSVAERIAASDLSKEVLVTGTDEAGRLLRALAQMQANLRITIMQISDSSTQLASASAEMTAVTWSVFASWQLRLRSNSITAMELLMASSRLACWAVVCCCALIFFIGFKQHLQSSRIVVVVAACLDFYNCAPFTLPIGSRCAMPNIRIDNSRLLDPVRLFNILTVGLISSAAVSQTLD